MDSELNAMVDAPDRCPRFGKWLRGCRFEPRYSEPEFKPAPLPQERYWGDDLDVVSTLMEGRPRIYEGDVCIRCGKRAMKPEPAKDPAA